MFGKLHQKKTLQKLSKNKVLILRRNLKGLLNSYSKKYK